jgi:transcriptional regulator with XRE-family HTH domain
MNKTELKAIRERMGLSQTEFAARLRMDQGSISRMESGQVIITPAMELLIGYVARDAGVEVAYSQRSRGAAPAKERANRGKARHPVRKDR